MAEPPQTRSRRVVAARPGPTRQADTDSDQNRERGPVPAPHEDEKTPASRPRKARKASVKHPLNSQNDFVRSPAAAALTRAGIQASVYEQASALGEVGAGVLIGPNSVRLLHRLGLAEAIDAVGGWVGEGSTYYRHDGTRVAPVMTTDSSGWAAMYGMHRADLIDVLRRAVPDDRIHPGHRAVSFDQDADRARVVFENGAVAEADMVVAADGIHSALRRFVTEPTAPVFSGQISYRGVLDTSRVPWWPERIFQVWMGEGKHVIVFPVRAGRMLNFVCFVPAAQEMRESWSAPGDPDALRAAFEGFADPVTSLLRQVDSTFWWGLYDREPLAEWTRGRLAL
ncbi:MAG: FAD-dependent monooxygenase, partial [Streptosporangiaceae bacterium]